MTLRQLAPLFGVSKSAASRIIGASVSSAVP
ncbi:helix-turn-helix domain-containing protein [Streptomyces griseorubiginosus]